MSYNFYKVTEPERVLMIAKTAEAALKEYQEEVSDTVEGAAVEELSQLDFIVQLIQMTAERTSLTKYGLKEVTLDIQKSISCLKKSGKEAIIVFKEC